MNKSTLEEILKEEIQAIINERELDEQGFASKVGGFLKGLRRPGDLGRSRRAKTRAMDRQADASDFNKSKTSSKKSKGVPRPGRPLDKYDSRRKVKKVSLLDDIIPRVEKKLGYTGPTFEYDKEERQKNAAALTDFAEKFGDSFPDGIKFGDKEQRADKNKMIAHQQTAKALEMQIKRLEKEVNKAKEKAKSEQDNAAISKKFAIKQLRTLYKKGEEGLNSQILSMIIDELPEDGIIVEHLLTEVIYENLKGNRVVL
tara:strand:- start:8455 stop:9225 length:771 start_codon:yes stop_codon:yes gene_type:complete